MDRNRNHLNVSREEYEQVRQLRINDDSCWQALTLALTDGQHHHKRSEEESMLTRSQLETLAEELLVGSAQFML